MKISRRHFLRSSGAIALGFMGLRTFLAQPVFGQIGQGYGDLIPDPNGILDLPEGFSYHVISRTGDVMDDGFRVPAAHDGMATFPASNGKTILVRNHELINSGSAFGARNELLGGVDQKLLYDAGKGRTPAAGGTTTLVYDTQTGQLEKHYLSLAGTLRNCAGGPTPWNSWISCEEAAVSGGFTQGDFTATKEHGYTFEVPASAKIGLVMPVPLKAMGRFFHEAVAVHPETSIVYQTEDRQDALIYRFIPLRPGELTAGGRLQALKIRGMKSVDTRNWKRQVIQVDEPMDVEWLGIENVESPRNDLRYQGFAKGASRFARGEGMWYDMNTVYFACTNGGARRAGQIWSYTPSPFEGTPEEDSQPGRIELFIEPNNSDLLENAAKMRSPQGGTSFCVKTVQESSSSSV